MPSYKLLGVEGDAKTRKGSKKGILTGVMYLAPSKEADGVHNLCPFATSGPNGCEEVCLYGAGMAQAFPSIKAARIAKTLRYLNDRKAFIADLTADIAQLEREAKSRHMTAAVRINGTSDLPQLALEMARLFPGLQFYDYTKIPQPWKRTLPNYHLTFSFSGENLADCKQALEHGVNVAVVFAGGLPSEWHGHRVVSGDDNDLRFLDPKGVVVGLTPKGDARKATAGGFVQIGKAAA